MEHDYTLDEAKISSAVIRERYYRDSKQWDKLRAAYHPDASKTLINISWYNGEIDGFVKGSREMVSSKLTSLHVISPVDIDIKGSKAFAVSVGSINARFERDGLAYDLISHCRFLSRLEKVAGQTGNPWKLLTMEVIYIYDSIIPAFPGSLDIGKASGAARSSYRYLSWLLEDQGRKVDRGMPGLDDEASVKEIMDRNLGWLNQ